MQCCIDDFRVFLFFVGFEAFDPGLVCRFLHELGHLRQCLLAVAEHGECRLHVLAEFRGVYFKVNDFGLLGVGFQVARHAVIEAHAYGDEQVALVGHDVGGEVAVHAEHSHVQGVVGGCGRQAEDGGGEWYLCFLAEFEQFAVGSCQFNALTYEHEGLYAFVYHAGSFLACALFGLRVGIVARLSVLCKVEHDGSRSAALCDEEGPGYCPGDVLGPAYLVVPLRDGPGHAYHIDLLEGVCAEHGCTYLTADDDHRRRVNHGIGNAGDGVHGTRATGHDGAAHLAADAGIALSCMDGSLFVTNKYVMQGLLVVVESVVGWHDGTARVAEENVNAFMLKAPHQSLCTAYLFCHIWFFYF